MTDAQTLSPGQKVDGYEFADPHHSQGDLDSMRHMAHQLVDIYDDPVKCDFVPGQNLVCQSDPLGRHFRIYYIQPKPLFTQKDLTVVGFFGQKRPNADIRPLIKADKLFEQHFHDHPGLLSLSTVRLPEGDFGNLVLFTDPESKDAWNYSQPHYDVVSKISPPYYKSVRLNNGILPGGLAEPDSLRLTKVKYIDYGSNPPWRAVREL